MVAGKSRDMLLKAIGEAVEAYTAVEAAQSQLLAIILGVNDDKAAIIFFAVQNVRLQQRMFEGLLLEKYGQTHQKYWASYASYIFKLAEFRNAIVHWHHITIQNATGPSEAGMRRPTPKGRGYAVTVSQLRTFIQDCVRARLETDEFATFLRDGGGPTLHDRFLRPIVYRNQAVLPPLPMPKAQQSQPRSSRPKR